MSEKTVKLIIESPLCTEEIEVPAELWKRFEKRAIELEMPPEDLFPIVMDNFLKEKGY